MTYYYTAALVPEGDTFYAAIRCLVCGDTFLILGESISARRAALANWPGCCTPDADLSATPPRTVRQAAGGGRIAAPAATQDDLPATYKRRPKVRPGKSRPSLLSGVPAWVGRRWAVGR